MAYQSPRTPIGRRRHRIALQSLVTTDDGMGGQIPVTTDNDGYLTFGEAWAAVTPLDERTKEALAAQQITARHGYFLDIKYRTDILPSHRVVWDDKTLQIHSVADDEGKKRRLILQVGEVQR
jgi:SPP1 family predicted phage head-tail adaptor